MLERGKSSQKTNQLINSNLVSVLKEFLASGSEFWESGKTLKRLAEEDYFKADDELVWPETIKKMISDCKSWFSYIICITLWKESLTIASIQYQQIKQVPLTEHKNRPQYVTLEILVLAWDRHKNVAELNRLIWSQLSPLDNWTSSGNTYLNKR